MYKSIMISFFQESLKSDVESKNSSFSWLTFKNVSEFFWNTFSLKQIPNELIEGDFREETRRAY